MSDKPYINGISLKAKQWPNGGETISCNIKVEDFTNDLAKYMDENGWVKVDIKRRKTVSPKGHTHYMEAFVVPPKQNNDDGAP